MNVTEGATAATTQALVSQPTSVTTSSSSSAATKTATLTSSSSATESTSTPVVRPKDPNRPQTQVESSETHMSSEIEWIRPADFDLETMLFYVSF